jgi:hypothetical protein
MPSLLEQAISTDDGDRAAQIIQQALGRIRRGRQLRVSEDLAERPREARPHHRRMAAAACTNQTSL